MITHAEKLRPRALKIYYILSVALISTAPISPAYGIFTEDSETQDLPLYGRFSFLSSSSAGNLSWAISSNSASSNPIRAIWDPLTGNFPEETSWPAHSSPTAPTDLASSSQSQNEPVSPTAPGPIIPRIEVLLYVERQGMSVRYTFANKFLIQHFLHRMSPALRQLHLFLLATTQENQLEIFMPFQRVADYRKFLIRAGVFQFPQVNKDDQSQVFARLRQMHLRMYPRLSERSVQELIKPNRVRPRLYETQRSRGLDFSPTAAAAGGQLRREYDFLYGTRNGENLFEQIQGEWILTKTYTKNLDGSLVSAASGYVSQGIFFPIQIGLNITHESFFIRTNQTEQLVAQSNILVGGPPDIEEIIPTFLKRKNTIQLDVETFPSLSGVKLTHPRMIKSQGYRRLAKKQGNIPTSPYFNQAETAYFESIFQLYLSNDTRTLILEDANPTLAVGGEGLFYLVMTFKRSD